MKIGIFSGKFDPVHKGHIIFALEAARLAGLDKVYLLPEPYPRRTETVTHLAHRVAMIRLAVEPYKKLGVLDLPDKSFSVARTLPRIQSKFPGSQLYMLIGSDIVKHLNESTWPGFERMLESTRLVVGMRVSDNQEHVATKLQEIIPSRKFHVIKTEGTHVSSSEIRAALHRGENHDNTLSVLMPYIKSNWLYVSVNNLS